MRRLAALGAGLLALLVAPAAGGLELGLQDDRLYLGPPVTADGAPGVSPARGLALRSTVSLPPGLAGRLGAVPARRVAARGGRVPRRCRDVAFHALRYRGGGPANRRSRLFAT